MKRQAPIPGRFLPIGLLTVAVVLTSAALLWLAWGLYQAHEVFRTRVARALKAEELRGTIAHLDEALTMSAHMAAASGDKRWEERYRELEPRLGAAIRAAMRLQPEGYAGKAAQTDAANAKLVDMESQAFELVRQGRVDQAQAILSGEPYKAQKRLYADSMARMAVLLREDVNMAVLSERNRALTYVAVAIVVVPVLILGWLAILQLLRRSHATLIESNEKLATQAERLVELNLGLDQQIMDRTRALELSNEAVRQSEKRYRGLFENSPVALREEDFAEVKTLLDQLRESGVRDFPAYFARQPQAVADCARSVKLVDVNNAALELHRARTKQELHASYSSIFDEESYAAFQEELVAIAEGKTGFENETTTRTLDGQRKSVWLRWSVAPGHEDTLSKVLISVIDITQRKRTEEALSDAEAEFRVARDIQRGLFPQPLPPLPGFDIAGASYPAVATSGDYFDYIVMSDGTLGIVIGDVTSHGLGPALLMADTRACLRAFATASADPGEILTRANRILAEDTGDGRFITLFFARLDVHKRTFVYASAGHEGYLLDQDGRRTALESTSCPLGVSYDAVVPCSPTIALEPGNILLLMTDGIVEAESPDEGFFGAQRGLDVVHAHRDKAAQGVIQALRDAAVHFRGDQPQLDDLTAVVVKVEPTG